MDSTTYNNIKAIYDKKKYRIIFMDRITNLKIPPYKIKRFVRRNKFSLEYFYNNIYLVSLTTYDNYGYTEVIFFNPTKQKIVKLSYIIYEDMTKLPDKEHFSNILELYLNQEVNAELLHYRNHKYGLIYIMDMMTYSAFQNIGLMEACLRQLISSHINTMFFIKAQPRSYWHVPRSILTKFLNKLGFVNNKIVDRILPKNDYMFKY
jgi:uncharacterized membrane protein